MKNFKNIFFAIAIITVMMTTYACDDTDNNTTGTEFMPDMAHSIANEANILNEYNLNTWQKEHGSVISLRETSTPRKPVAGTVPRGQAAVAISDSDFSNPQAAVQHTRTVEKYSNNDIPISPNGSAPYYFEDSDSGRIAATEQLIYNPYPITADGLARGKVLYNTFCAICHGEKGDGNGWLVAEDNPNAKYPAAPAILINEEFTAASNGRMYHAIMWGKNVMGHYKDKISYEERWQVVHWIRALQAKEYKKKYDENTNSLNPEFGVPGASLSRLAEVVEPMQLEQEEATDNEGHSGENHGGDHGEGH